MSNIIPAEAYNYKQEIIDANSIEDLNSIKVKYFGKKGIVTSLNKGLRDVEPQLRKAYGEEIHSIRVEFENLFSEKEIDLNKKQLDEKIKNKKVDITLPGYGYEIGHIHPLTKVYYEIVEIFTSFGYEVAEGPDIEDEFHNFDALNIPATHPARDSQDTFFLGNGKLLRTHTSPVQIRSMLSQKPPIKIIAPGKVYRNDYDNTHTPMFHQLEGLVLDKGISFADLKGALHGFIHALFGENTNLRFRSSFFPFTEPSAEIDITCVKCNGVGCNVCKGTGWIEILGCGMVDPNVLKAVDIDPNEYQGFAWGMGIERIAMLKYGIDDLRLLFENNIKFLNQF